MSLWLVEVNQRKEEEELKKVEIRDNGADQYTGTKKQADKIWNGTK